MAAKSRSVRNAISPPQTRNAEFVVLRLTSQLTPGATVTFLGATDSMNAARALVEQLDDNTPSRVAILQLAIVLDRKPAMLVTEVQSSLTEQ